MIAMGVTSVVSGFLILWFVHEPEKVTGADELSTEMKSDAGLFKLSDAAKLFKEAGVSAQALETAANAIRKGRTADSASAEQGYDALKKYARDLTEAAEQVGAAGYEITEPLVEFTAMPGIGYFFVADPDGNWVELAGPL